MNTPKAGSSRRDFLRIVSSTALGASFLSSVKLAASTQCYANGSCTAQVDFAQFAQEAYQSQKRSEWCWAASISMIFAFYGHTVSQDRIVSEVYGAPVNMPSGYGINMARQLNRKWKDDDGNCFRATLTGVYDAQAGVDTLTNADLIRELDNDHPILIGTGGHAMVLTAMQYIGNPSQPTITLCGAFDPWPGRGARNLTLAEVVPIGRGGALAFLATARVKDITC